MDRDPLPARVISPSRLFARLLSEDGEQPADGTLSFDVYARRITLRLSQALMLLACALAVTFWPVDSFVFAKDPRRLAVSFAWRTIIVLTMVLIVMFGRRMAPTGKSSGGVLATFYLLLTAVTFLTASTMGDPSTPWLYTVFVLPLFTTMMLVGFVKRVLLVYAGIAVALVSYFAFDTSHLRYPWLWAFISILAVVCLLFVAVGHMLYVVIRENFEQRQELRRLSQTDSLTGLLNHSHLCARGAHELTRARRSHEPVSVLMLDVDYFKRVNDSFGHDAGDALLRDMAGLFRHLVREIDWIGRMGGEEFAIVLPRTSVAAAIEVAERIRRAVEGTSSIKGGGPARCTVSIGVAELAADDGFDTLLRRADQALYEAKAQGRNRVTSR